MKTKRKFGSLWEGRGWPIRERIDVFELLGVYDEPNQGAKRSDAKAAGHKRNGTEPPAFRKKGGMSWRVSFLKYRASQKGSGDTE